MTAYYEPAAEPVAPPGFGALRRGYPAAEEPDNTWVYVALAVGVVMLLLAIAFVAYQMSGGPPPPPQYYPAQGGGSRGEMARGASGVAQIGAGAAAEYLGRQGRLMDGGVEVAVNVSEDIPSIIDSVGGLFRMPFR
jgi:hypothetical protein